MLHRSRTVSKLAKPRPMWTRRLHAAALAVGLSLIPAAAMARDYFVRTDGNDSNSGTANTAAGAFRTVKKCAAAVRAGDRCLIQPGIYRESGIEPAYGGTKSDNVMSNCACTNGSTAITCASNITGVAAGDFVQCDAGYGFFWTEVASVSGSTLNLVEPYRGATTSGDTLDSAKFVQFVGANGTTPAAREDVTVTSLFPQPAGLSWTQEATCVYSYPLSSTTDPVWRDPGGFREVVSFDQWDLHDDNKNGLDAYDSASAGSCPCNRASLVDAVRDVPGSWANDATKVYVQTRTCKNPSTIQLQAGNGSGYATTFKVSRPLTIVRGLTFEVDGSDSMQSNTEKWAFMMNASNDVLVRNVRCHGGRCGVFANGVKDVRLDDLRALHTLKLGSGDSLNNSGLVFYNVEARGGYSNMVTIDSLSGASQDDPVVFDRFYVHRGWTAKRNSLCGQTDLWNCSAQPGAYFSDQVDRAAHGTYIGNAGIARTVNNLLFQNCIYEVTYDGPGLFNSAGSNITIRNCTFASGEYIGAGNSAAPGAGIKIYNSIWHCPNGLCSRQMYYYGGAWPTSGIVSDYNAYLFDSNGGQNAVTGKNYWTNSANTDDWHLDQIRVNRGQEANSVVVCASGCSSSQGVRVFNDGAGASRLTDTDVKDGNGSNYTPLPGSRVIDAGLNAQCPAEDFYGNPRRDGRCDIGAVELQSGQSDTTPPNSVTAFSAAPEDSAIALSWTYSTSTDAKGAVVRVRTDRYPSSPSDGTEACRRDGAAGSTGSCRYSPATNGTNYYFSAFAYDFAGNHSGAANASGVPTAPDPPSSVGGVRRTDTK